LSDARTIIERHEWLGTMPAVARCAFGLFFGDRLGGAVIYGDEYAENRGVWDRYGFTGRIVALLRGACLPWAHPHSASKLIRRSMALLPERFRVVTATCCAAAGEVGTIYQACGFDYVGAMRRSVRALIYYAGRIISDASVHAADVLSPSSVFVRISCRAARAILRSSATSASRKRCATPSRIGCYRIRNERTSRLRIAKLGSLTHVLLIVRNSVDRLRRRDGQPAGGTSVSGSMLATWRAKPRTSVNRPRTRADRVAMSPNPSPASS
jgi:hypothetical protein